VVAGPYDEQDISDYFAANNLAYTAEVQADEQTAIAAYRGGQCDVLSAPVSRLAAARSVFPDKDQHTILPEISAKEPIAVAVRVGDDDWFNLVRWVYFALLDADELGVTSANVDQMLGSDNVEIKRLLGVEGDFGTPMGVSKDWVYQIVKLVGNYGEVFDHNVGPKTPLGLTRGLNALSKDGGLQVAPPIR
jgi:general L-amino acid transport system substrate-binding protein